MRCAPGWARATCAELALRRHGRLAWSPGSTHFPPLASRIGWAPSRPEIKCARCRRAKQPAWPQHGWHGMAWQSPPTPHRPPHLSQVSFFPGWRGPETTQSHAPALPCPAGSPLDSCGKLAVRTLQDASRTLLPAFAVLHSPPSRFPSHCAPHPGCAHICSSCCSLHFYLLSPVPLPRPQGCSEPIPRCRAEAQNSRCMTENESMPM